MFRSLLLLSVLATVSAIAFKSPDQTALQYAAEISGKVREILPQTETLPTPDTLNQPLTRSPAVQDPGGATVVNFRRLTDSNEIPNRCDERRNHR